MGKAIWQLGRVPTTQLWARSSYGDPEVNSAWLFRALIWKVWSLGGIGGLQAWRWATTLAAFLPMVFWPGIVGEFMKYLPITLIITLSASLFVALVIVPSLCGQFLELEGAPRRPLTRTARWLLVGGAGLALLAVLATNWLTALLMALTATGLYLFHTRVGVPVTRWFMDVGLTRLIADTV